MSFVSFWEPRHPQGTATLSCSLHVCPTGSLCDCFAFSHSFLLLFSSALCPLLYLVFCFPRALAYSAPRWPRFWLVASFPSPCSFHICWLPPSLLPHFRLLRGSLIGLLCHFTPSHMIDCRPGGNLAALGSSAHLWSNSWKDGPVWHP